MKSFEEKYGYLTVGQVIKLNKIVNKYESKIEKLYKKMDIKVKKVKKG